MSKSKLDVICLKGEGGVVFGGRAVKLGASATIRRSHCRPARQYGRQYGRSSASWEGSASQQTHCHSANLASRDLLLWGLYLVYESRDLLLFGLN